MSTLLDTLEALEKAATPGPWAQGEADPDGIPYAGAVFADEITAEGDPYNCIIDTTQRADAALIAAARNALPVLLRVARALSALDALMDFGAPLDQEAMIFADQTAINAAMAEARAALAALEPPHA